MIVELISVGTELLLGHVTNTDARDVSELLSKIGINVLYHTVVGDNPQRLEDCVKVARERADIIITTGGLGPTCDDLTKEILARAFDVKLVEDKREMDTLYDYINLGKKLTDNNFRQALLPEGCTVFHNTAGTAPGCAFEKDGKVVVMLPGPPKECRIMLEKSAIPYLRQLSDEKIVSHTINIFGIGESAMETRLRSFMDGANPTVAPYSREGECWVRVTAKGANEQECEALMEPVIEDICDKMGDLVYGIDCHRYPPAGGFHALELDIDYLDVRSLSYEGSCDPKGLFSFHGFMLLSYLCSVLYCKSKVTQSFGTCKSFERFIYFIINALYRIQTTGFRGYFHLPACSSNS